jgi:hypothetical protein
MGGRRHSTLVVARRVAVLILARRCSSRRNGREFVEAFATIGYETVAARDHDPDFEKVAIFASTEGVPTHMARQLPNGSWTSKLGGLEDIVHVEVSGVAGSDYGHVVAILQRRRSTA